MPREPSSVMNGTRSGIQAFRLFFAGTVDCVNDNVIKWRASDIHNSGERNVSIAIARTIRVVVCSSPTVVRDWCETMA